jgi:hypothetical protein
MTDSLKGPYLFDKLRLAKKVVIDDLALLILGFFFWMGFERGGFECLDIEGMRLKTGNRGLGEATAKSEDEAS